MIVLTNVVVVSLIVSSETDVALPACSNSTVEWNIFDSHLQRPLKLHSIWVDVYKKQQDSGGLKDFWISFFSLNLTSSSSS